MERVLEFRYSCVSTSHKIEVCCSKQSDDNHAGSVRGTSCIVLSKTEINPENFHEGRFETQFSINTSILLDNALKFLLI